MKKIQKLITYFLLALSLLFVGLDYSYASDTNLTHGGANTSSTNGTEASNTHLQGLKNPASDFTVGQGGQKGIYNIIIRAARDLKNLFFTISGVYFLVLVIRLVFSNKTEEEVSNFKNGIVWISLGVMVTQIAYSFVYVLFDQDINSYLAGEFIGNILKPLINLLHTVVSFIFIGIMIYAFYRIISANGDEEKIRNGKMSVLYAIIGFIAVRFAYALVDSTYMRLDCSSVYGGTCKTSQNLAGFADIVVTIINWVNGFIGIIVVLMIIYAGFLTFTSFGDEEKLKKTKSIIIYIAVGLLVLVTNYLILTFFVVPETTL